MKKTIKFTGLDCPNCAAKLEKKLSKISNVNNVTISFMASKLLIDYNDSCENQVLSDLVSITKKYEKEVEYEL